MDSLLFSYAKLNLFLYVTERLPSGYHSIFSLFSRISLCDIIKIHRRAGSHSISISMVDGPDISACENICYNSYFK